MSTKLIHAFVVATTLLLPVVAIAQKPSQPTTRLGVDVVSIRNGPQLFGAIISQDASGLTMAVERVWLKKTHQKFYEEQVQLEKAEEIVAGKKLRERIDLWIEARGTDTNLVFFLENELKRLKAAWQQSQANPKPPTQFVIVDVPADRVRSLFKQPAERKQVALVAWRERLERVTVRTVNNLAKELREKGVEPPTQPITLFDRLPTKTQSEKEWAAKVAVVEYRMRKKVSFQGTGDYLARTGDGASAVDMLGMMQAVLQQQAQAQLQSLLNPNKPKVDSKAWLKKAIKEAEPLEVTGFRVSRLDKNMVAKTVDVTAVFLARMPDDTWKTVWEHKQSRSISDVKQEQLDQVVAAPQIKVMMAQLKAAGVAGNQQQIQDALAYGAVTKDALDDANEAFQKFVAVYGSKVESPRLTVP